MKYMLMHYSDEAMEADIPPTPEMIEAMGEYMAEVAATGVLLAAEGVRASSYGARLTVDDGGKVTVVDGPFAEAKELIAGFGILDVKSKEEAIEHAKRFAKVAGVTKIDVRLVAEF
jgi:hypothetical protein